MENDWLTLYGEDVEKTGLPGAEAPDGEAAAEQPGTEVRDGKKPDKRTVPMS